MGHGHRGDLVRDGEGTRRRLALGPAFRVRLDEGREVGPGVGEEILHAARGEELEVGFCGALDGGSLAHVNSPWRAGGERKSVPSLAPGGGRVKAEGGSRGLNDELAGR